MHLLIYSLNYSPEPTGTGKYSGEMATWLAARGHTVEVVCGLPHYPLWKLDSAYSHGKSLRETTGGVEVLRASHFIPTPEAVNARNRIRLETSFTLSATRYWVPRLFARKRPDAVIAVMPPMQIGVWPMVYGWLRRVPWVLHVQDLQVDAALRLGMLPGGVAGRLLYRTESFLLRKATRVSTITEPMRKRLISKGTSEDKTWLFPNWSDITSVRPEPRENAFRADAGIGAEPLIVLYSGNMGEKQGLDSVLDAAYQLRKQVDIQFLMVGHGAAKTRLEQRARDLNLENLRFLPVQPLEKLSNMLAAADIHLVVQKRNAGDLVMPSKLTNILAAGRPCVATADAGTALADVVENHGTGLLAPPEDPVALGDAIMTLARDAALRKRLGGAARAYAERHLDKDRILGQFESDLLDLVTQDRHE